ncbi:unnamed protein product [Effrenium voratum]|nr:unnamed protein product [Effrenium voratum]
MVPEATPAKRPEEAKVVQEVLEAMLDIAARDGLGGIHRLVEMFRKVDCLERLQRGVELLDSARLLKPRPTGEGEGRAAARLMAAGGGI